MGRLIDMDQYRRRVAAERGFAPWTHRFGFSFDENASVRLLDNLLIRCLVKGDEESSAALYELIMGIKGLGHAQRFSYLDNAAKMEVTDITIFLLDLVRFEAMHRLGWLDNYRLLEIPLIDLVRDFEHFSSATRQSSPEISDSHPLFEEYETEFEGDRNSFIRKLIPEAIRVFCDREDDPINK